VETPVTFLIFVAAFVTLACVGVPLVTWALLAALHQGAAEAETGERPDGPAATDGPRVPAIDFSHRRV
jgi:hypothetical protein